MRMTSRPGRAGDAGRAGITAWVLGVLAWLLLAAGLAHAQDVQPVPALSGRVVDQAALLLPAQREALSNKLAAIENAHGSQVVVLTVKTTQPEDNASYAQRIADSWKIGRKGVGDGLLIVVASEDRRVRIEVAKALEGAIPDLEARRIISDEITPAFKQGDYAGGLNRAVDRIGKRIAGEGLPAVSTHPGAVPGLDSFDWQGLLLMFVFVLPVFYTVLNSLFGRKIGALAAGGGTGAFAWFATQSVLIGVAAGLAGLVFALIIGVVGLLRGAASARPGYRGRSSGAPPIIWGSGGGWGGGGGGGGGGGFSSGGGGDFGGGGASGSW